MKLYRIHTERHSNLSTITSEYFDDFTLLHGVGFWRGGAEDCSVVEIVGTEADRASVLHLANRIKAVNRQHAVLVTEADIVSELV